MNSDVNTITLSCLFIQILPLFRLIQSLENSLYLQLYNVLFYFLSFTSFILDLHFLPAFIFLLWCITKYFGLITNNTLIESSLMWTDYGPFK